MAFTITSNVHIRRDKDGNIRLLSHPQEPYKLKDHVRTFDHFSCRPIFNAWGTLAYSCIPCLL